MLKKQLLLLSLLLATIGACGADDDESKPTNAKKPEDAATEASTKDDKGTDQPANEAVEVVDCAGVTADKEVSMESIAFAPGKVTISAGQVVKWTNKDAIAHTVTSGRANDSDAGDLFDSGNVNKDESTCMRFNDKGTYNYWCRPHPVQMNDGVVTVE